MAGFALNVKNPNKDPTSINKNVARSEYPFNQSVFHVIIPNVVMAIIDRPAARPSNPSVKLTAFVVASNTSKINIVWIM